MRADDTREVACQSFFQILKGGESDIVFNEEGVAAFTDEEGQLIRFEKGEDNALFIEFNPLEKKVSRDKSLSLLQRANLRTKPPFSFYVSWLGKETEPRLVIRLTSQQHSPDKIQEALEFLKRLIDN